MSGRDPERDRTQGGMPETSYVPTSVEGPDGTSLDLPALASEVCRRYYEEYADEEEIYAGRGRAWCQHDNQHLLNWAVLSVAGMTDLDAEVSWLAGLLDKRDFPIDRLARNLEIGAEVMAEGVGGGEWVAANLRSAATMLRDTWPARAADGRVVP